MLHYNRAIPDSAAGDYVADAHLAEVAPAQRAIDRKVEKRSVPETPVLVQPKSNGPNLLRFEGAVCAPHSTLIPGAAFMKARSYDERPIAYFPIVELPLISTLRKVNYSFSFMVGADPREQTAELRQSSCSGGTL